MDTNSSHAPSWWITTLQALAVPIAGAIAGLLVWLFKDRRKQGPELKVLDATRENLEAATEKGRAETSQLYVQTIRETNEQLNAMREIVIEQHNEIRGRDKLIRSLERDRDLWLIDRGMMEGQMQHMEAILRVNGIKLSDYDYLRKTRPPEEEQ
jgi:hypothetical protein